ncbi:cytochrome P450 [Sanghuangporus baumii]|uniref:Cytochrome P450 n=1 Tax=Sanghuangporus baumii TaxID=108892 RepID=A0A9Q5HV14_SANBA|nr:cytochrome P450 [Sanghuangporus baumii]
MQNSSSWGSVLLETFLADATGEGELGPYFSLALAGICIALVSIVRQIAITRKLPFYVPLEAPSGTILFYTGAYEFLKNTKSILRQAYKKYGQATFRVPELDHYTVVINKPELVDEIKRASDDTFSIAEASVEVWTLAARWTSGENVFREPYHVHIIQNQLTRSLNASFENIRDEIAEAFNDLIPARTDEWVAFPALQTMRNIVCRTSNRIFVGLPLCRDPDYIDLNINFTIDVIYNLYTIRKFPSILRPIVGNLVSSLPRNLRRGMKHLRPLFEERLRLYEENINDWPAKPNDMISWIIDGASEQERTSIKELTRRMLFVNFAAIHTSSNSFTHALFHLATEPHYIAPLREEVATVIKEEGWTKVAMTKMWKLDSFLKESIRINGIFTLTLNRKVMRDYTMSDGTFLPAGTFVAANIAAQHSDDAHYPDADKFDGFRFSKMREQSVEESVKHQTVNTASDYLAFGHGRHACPGRFFAVNELKAMMAYLLMNYDVKSEVEGVRPENVYMGTRLIPNPTAKVLIKKRANI